MSFTNINDPAGISALLEQLRSSQAWQDTVNTQAEAGPSARPSPSSVLPPPIQPPFVPTPVALLPAAATAEPTTSVASLLSQLHASPTFTAIIGPPSIPQPLPGNVLYPGVAPYPVGAERAPPAILAPAPKQNLRTCTFQQSLPHLARLTGDPKFVETITAMKKEQADLERQLWHERRAIQHKHESKVTVARTKANMIGAGLTQFEADTMSEGFRKELTKFDVERALPAWDGLVTKQQAALERLGVPTMFPTNSTTDRDRQQRVMQVLGGVGEEL